MRLDDLPRRVVAFDATDLGARSKSPYRSRKAYKSAWAARNADAEKARKHQWYLDNREAIIRRQAENRRKRREAA